MLRERKMRSHQFVSGTRLRWGKFARCFEPKLVLKHKTTGVEMARKCITFKWGF